MPMHTCLSVHTSEDSASKYVSFPPSIPKREQGSHSAPLSLPVCLSLPPISPFTHNLIPPKSSLP